MGLTNWFDSGEFFVGLLIDTSYYSKLWLINRGNLTDELWYDTYDRDATMEVYGK